MFFGIELVSTDSDDELDYDPVGFPTLDPLLWRPISAGLWRQHEATDGTYTSQDLCDVLEFLNVKDENRRRYEVWRAARQKED